MANSPQLETAVQMGRDLVAKEATSAQEMRANFGAAASELKQVAEDIAWELEQNCPRRGCYTLPS